MQHDQFIGQVQARAGLSSRGHAERATRGTLETLGERIPEGLASNLAAQLPPEIGEHLRRTITHGGEARGEPFDHGTFVARVAERTGAGEPTAVHQTRVVLEVVGEAINGQVMDRVRSALPEALRSFVTSGNSGQAASPS